MRRPRAPVAVWPAFADLMTVFAVLGLLAVSSLFPEVARLASDLRLIAAKLDAERNTATDLRTKLESSERELATEIRRRRELEQQLQKAGGIDTPPCVVTTAGRPQPILRITVGRALIIRAVSPADGNGLAASIPGLSNLLAAGSIDKSTFIGNARQMFDYSQTETNQFKQRCRFFVELKRDTDSVAAFVNAYALVTRYFFISNSAEVDRSLTSPE